MRHKLKVTFIAALMLAGAQSQAFAYIGPGLGAGAVGAVLGFFGALVLALIALVYYPIKRALRRRKNSQARED